MSAAITGAGAAAGKRVHKLGGPILKKAAEIVESYDTPVSLRQLFYRLVALQLIRNTPSEYGMLAHRTAAMRREGKFPDLIDETRKIHVARSFDGPAEVLESAVDSYRRDRTEEQPFTIFLATEKRGIVKQLQAWFGYELGIPILALGGYPTTPYMKRIAQYVEGYDRPAIVIYAGDLDCDGLDIDRDFGVKSGLEIIRMALTMAQVEKFELPVAAGKDSSPRAWAFSEKYGSNIQFELDALDPDTLRNLFDETLQKFWDPEAYRAVMEREVEEREELERIVGEPAWSPPFPSC
jgi:hypothetical protein